MKKALLGTTALVAAGLVAQNAQAADPISLSVGGYQNWGVYFASYDNDDGIDDNGIRNEGEIHFKGKTVLDNGLEVGVRFELEGEEEDGDQMDETYVWVEGSFGTFRIGNDDPAATQMATAAPYASYIWGLNSPSFSIGSSAGVSTMWPSTFAGVEVGDSASVMYFTPVFNGFQFGLSYAPEAGMERRSENSYVPAEPEGNDAWSIAGRYDGELSGVGVTLAAGYVAWDKEAPDTSWTDWDVGLVLSFDNISVGGSYAVRDDDTNNDVTRYDLGVRYGEGPWAISLATGNVEDDAGSVDHNFHRLTGTYSLGAGVTLVGALGMNRPEADNSDSEFLGTAIAVSF